MPGSGEASAWASNASAHRLSTFLKSSDSRKRDDSEIADRSLACAASQSPFSQSLFASCIATSSGEGAAAARACERSRGRVYAHAPAAPPPPTPLTPPLGTTLHLPLP